MKPLEFEEVKEAELKTLNADPGVGSNHHIDRLGHSPGLPTINETISTDKPINRSLLELRNENPQRNRLNSEPNVGHLRHRKHSDLEVDGDKTVPVLIRKDIFYSGSIQNLKEFQSQKSLQAYKSSNASLNKERRKSSSFAVIRRDSIDATSIKSTVNKIVDFGLLKEPAFLCLAISNLFGKF